MGVMALVALWLAHFSAIVGAHANYMRSLPEAGAALTAAPASVRVWFSEEVVPVSSALSVHDAQGARVDNADSHPAPDDLRSLIVSIRPLDTGTYTVAWETVSAVDGHAARGTFPFIVGITNTAVSYTALIAQVDREARSLQPPGLTSVVAQWWVLLSLALLAGGLMFAPVVLLARNLGAVRERLAPRRRRWLWLVCLFACAGVLLDALVRVTESGTAGVAGRYGLVLLVRVFILAVIAVLLWRRRDENPWVLLPASVLLLTQSLISHSAAEQEWIAPVVADWLHFVFASVWLGGVAVLAVCAPILATNHDSLYSLGAVIARFSPWAMFSVFAIVLTGIVQSAGFVGSFEALFNTAYGRALLIKIALLAVLVAFGAFHQQVIAPWLQPWRRDAERASHAGRRFRASIMAEMGVSVLMFLAVGILTSLPPSRDSAVAAAVATAPVMLQSRSVDDVALTLGVSPNVAGLNQIDVRLGDRNGDPIVDVEKVILRMKSLKSLTMAMGEAELILYDYGGGHYVSQSSDLSMHGVWQLDVIVRRPGLADTRTSFILDVR